MSQGLLDKRQDVTSRKLWGDDSKLMSFSFTQSIQALRKSSDTPLGDKFQCILLQRPWSFWLISWSPSSDNPGLDRQEEAALDKQTSSHVGVLPPVTLKATWISELREMEGKAENEGNLFGNQESLIWWKPQTRARLRSQEASGWGLRGWAGLTVVTRSRKALAVILGHGHWKKINQCANCSLFA